MKKQYIVMIAAVVALIGLGVFLSGNGRQVGNTGNYGDVQNNQGSILENNEPAVGEGDLVNVPEDFEEFRKLNEDVYAWIEIEDTNINYPILQSPNSDSYYLNHTVEHRIGLPGSIYTEKVNSKDFTDFNTLIYGHDMKDGTMFKHVHKFKDKEFFDEHEKIMIYTEDKALEYKVYAVVVYDDRHIMYTYDNDDEADREAFIKSLTKRKNLNNHFREGMTLDKDSKLITLSTCISGRPNNRLILVAELVKELSI